MKQNYKRGFASLAIAAALFASASAIAGPVKVTGPGNVSLDDVTLNSKNADQLVYSGQNPNAGPNGNTKGFVKEFASTGTGDWGLLGKLSTLDKKGFGTVTGGGFTFDFQKKSDTEGTWSVTNLSDKSTTLDLVFALHASNASTAFLFDNKTFTAGQTLSGDWDIDWLKNGNEPAYSNVTFFGRDQSFTTPTSPVPEPSSVAMLSLGLVALGATAKRKKAK